MSTTQAELDFMHNFRHETDGARWAKNEIESLRQKLASSNAKIVELVAALEYIAVDDCECGFPCDCYSWSLFANKAREVLAKVRKP